MGNPHIQGGVDLGSGAGFSGPLQLAHQRYREAERGHAFEVTPEGEVVWDFWNPEVGKDEHQHMARKRIYRMLRIAPSRVAPLLEKR